MTVVHIAVADHELVVDLDGDRRFTLPVGVAALRERELHADPPRPEELTNAIGLVADHLDDVVRADPSVIGADTVVISPRRLNAMWAAPPCRYIE